MADWQFDKHEFLKLSAGYGPFDVDACASASGQNAQVPKFHHSQHSFLQAQVQGMNVWLHPPYHKAEAFLRHYLDCKTKTPQTTSAVTVLPKLKDQSWWPLVKNMTVIREYPTGSCLFTAPATMPGRPRQTLGPTSWPTIIFWDPPTGVTSKLWNPDISEVASSTTDPVYAIHGATVSDFPDDDIQQLIHPHLVRVTAKIRHSEAKVLIDSGATSDFMDQTFAEKMQFPASHLPHVVVVFANGTRQRDTKLVPSLKYRIGVF